MAEYGSRIIKSMYASGFSQELNDLPNGLDPEVLDLIRSRPEEKDTVLALIQDEVDNGTPLEKVVNSFDVHCLDEKGGSNRLKNNLPTEPERKGCVTFY